MISHRYQTPAIVCDADRLSQIAIIQELGRCGVPIVALSATPRAMGFASKHVGCRIECFVPSYAPEFIDFLLSRVPRGVIFCSNDASAQNLAAFRDTLRSQGFSLLLSGAEVLDRVVSKDRLYTTARECGVAVPKCVLVSSAADLEERVDELGLPLILKSTNLAGGIYRFVPSREAAGAVFREMTEIINSDSLRHRNAGLMAQQWIPQKNSKLWNFNACVRHGSVLSFSMGRRIRTDTHPDGTLGSILLYGRTEYNAELYDQNCRLLRHLRFDGIMETEWSECHDGATRWFLYDFNPRPSGNIRWASQSGAPLALDAYRAALELPQEPRSMRAGIVYAKVLYRQSDWFEAITNRGCSAREKARVIISDLVALVCAGRHAVDVLDLGDIKPTIRACADLRPIVMQSLRAIARRLRERARDGKRAPAKPCLPFCIPEISGGRQDIRD